MADLRFEPYGESDWQVEGDTDAGVEFLDKWIPKDGKDFKVIDSGRIVVGTDGVEDVVREAKLLGLTAEHD